MHPVYVDTVESHPRDGSIHTFTLSVKASTVTDACEYVLQHGLRPVLCTGKTVATNEIVISALGTYSAVDHYLMEASEYPPYVPGMLMYYSVADVHQDEIVMHGPTPGDIDYLPHAVTQVRTTPDRFPLVGDGHPVQVNQGAAS